MYRFLFSSKWLGYFVLAVIFATGCVLLGRWQMDRRAETLAEINRVVTNYSATPVPFSAVKTEFQSLNPEREWTQVELHGSYDVSGERVVRNRPLNGQPGYEVVVPFRLSSGEAVVVDRGWLPIGNKTPGHPDSIPAPPAGQVTVVARLKASEPNLDRGVVDGQLASIDLPSYATELSYPIMTGAYGQLATESPAVQQMPAPFPMPATDEGTHLSYSLQWFAFGVLMFIGFGYAARQQARNAQIDAEDEDEEISAMPRRKAPAPRKSKRPTAEEEEDAILDAQGY
ncbi:SURF1 family protein [Arthrobacter sp. NA-172]|uniref:SURF1 family cytochrome oxidase biogenesis protein n=1 Tax=Arthrobacter sp. NA-172 TaxID=3367524 RepID=UPI0037549C8D